MPTNMSKSTQRLFQMLLRIPDVGKRAVHCVLFALLSVEWREHRYRLNRHNPALALSSIHSDPCQNGDNSIDQSVRDYPIQWHGFVQDHGTFRKMSKLSRSEFIVTLWAAFLLNGANACRAVHNYHAYT